MAAGPLIGLQFLMQGANSIYQYQADSAAAETENRRRAMQEQLSEEGLRRNLAFRLSSIQRSVAQKGRQLAQGEVDRAREVLQIEGQARAALGERGIGGNTADAILGEIEQQASLEERRRETEFGEFVADARESEAAAIDQTTSAILQSKLGRVEGPDSKTAILNFLTSIGSSVASSSIQSDAATKEKLNA